MLPKLSTGTRDNMWFMTSQHPFWRMHKMMKTTKTEEFLEDYYMKMELTLDPKRLSRGINTNHWLKAWWTWDVVVTPCELWCLDRSLNPWIRRWKKLSLLWEERHFLKLVDSCVPLVLTWKARSSYLGIDVNVLRLGIYIHVKEKKDSKKLLRTTALLKQMIT